MDPICTEALLRNERTIDLSVESGAMLVADELRADSFDRTVDPDPYDLSASGIVNPAKAAKFGLIR
ncbi:MAG: hypothetical protein WBR18_01940 [Anaerolineales bacterium]